MKNDILNLRHAATILLSLLMLTSGCAFEVENPGKPDDGSTKKSPANQKSTESPDNSQGSSAPTLSEKPSNTAEPAEACSDTVTYGAPNSSGQNGAVIKLAPHPSGLSHKLLIRNTAEDIFTDATAVIYAAGGEFQPALYRFEYRAADGRSCLLTLTVTEPDTSQKLEITVIVTPPNQ
ncbi:MAG: hypothetical protein RLZZ488_2398 [Pseudomonadota bacterium]|jgi:hypothetical protein